MDFKDKYKDFAAIEGHIRKAHAERSVAIAVALTEMVMAVAKGIKRFVPMNDNNLPFERDRHAIASDPFLKRAVPRY